MGWSAGLWPAPLLWGCAKRGFGNFNPEFYFVPSLKSERNSKLRPDNQGGTK